MSSGIRQPGSTPSQSSRARRDDGFYQASAEIAAGGGIAGLCGRIYQTLFPYPLRNKPARKPRFKPTAEELAKSKYLATLFPGCKVMTTNDPNAIPADALAVFAEDNRVSGSFAMALRSDPRAPIPAASPVYPHCTDCGCKDLCQPCPSEFVGPYLRPAAALEFWHPGGPESCTNPAGTMMHRKHGHAKCIETGLWFLAQDHTPIGNNYSIQDFEGSPQQHAVLNRHLLDYFRGVNRSRETTPYAIDNSQLYLLDHLGMERPLPDAPTRPHGLHKSIEELQLRRMKQWLKPEHYGLLSVKDSKLHLLPKPGSVQNPVYQAKDVSRYPGSGITTSHLREFPVHFLHDVSSEVGPHELVERLVVDNPSGHLFVTGMNPHEVLDRARSFEPASHVIDYDLEGFNFVFTGSESEAYYTPVATTVSWLRTSAIVGSNGLVYQVVLLDYKLGHCVWHIFQSDTAPQQTRTFGTGSYVQVPAVLTGTWHDEWLPANMLTAILSFAPRTPDTSFRNYAAKVSQLMTTVLPKMTAKEHWICTHLVHQLPGNNTWGWQAKRFLWSGLAFLSLQWHLLKAAPELFDFVDERKRYRVIHPTIGGGWSPRVKNSWAKSSIPNNPSMLQRVSAFTSSVFTFLLPKIVIGEVVSQLVMHLPLYKLVTHVWHWADINPLRLALTAAIIIVTAVLPGHIIKVFSRLAGHFWRMLWLPGWISTSVERLITEVCGGPGATVLAFLPGRGWLYQAYLWTVGVASVLPGLVPHFVLPWVAIHTPLGLVLAAWWIGIALENYLACCKVVPVHVQLDYVPRVWSYGVVDCVGDLYRLDFDSMLYSPFEVLLHSCQSAVRYGGWRLGHFVNGVSQFLAPSEASLRYQPPFVNLPALDVVQPAALVTRNIDRPLPAVILQGRLAPAVGAGQIAVDPVGMNFHEWVAEVSRQYQLDQVRYPQLTPGQSCFWDCVASFGGTAHMWYSWYMSYTGKVPNPNEVVIGNVVQSEMQSFCSASQFGLRLTGLSELAQDSRGGWPMLQLHLSRSPIGGVLHVEVATVVADTATVSSLARLLATVRRHWPLWAVEFERQFNASAVDSLPVASGELVAMSGAHALPTYRDEVADAIVGSYVCAPITPATIDGFAISLGAVYPNGFPVLIEYRAPSAGQRIAGSSAMSMWCKFTSAAKGLRLIVPEGYTHPLAKVPAKVGATVAQQCENASRDNHAPTPPRWTVLRNDLARILHNYKALSLPAVPLEPEFLSYTADLARASRLVADLKAHPGVLGSRGDAKTLQSLDAILDLHRLSGAKVTIPIRAYLGVAGCGKTLATVDYLKSLDPEVRQQVRIASHTESLRAKSKIALDFPQLKGFNFPTIPSLLTEPSTGPIVLDEAGKYWGGALDLIILANPLVSEIVVNGDPAQSMARFPVSGTQSEYDDSPLAALAPYVTRYATVSHRMFRVLADTLGVHTTNPIVGHITHTVSAKLGLPVCTASPRYAGVLAGAGRRAYTYEGIQGEDFIDEVEIDATGLESAILDRTAYVALTRSKAGVYLHMEALNPLANSKTQPTGSDLLNSIIFGMREGNTQSADCSYWLSRAAFMRHLENCMPSLAWFAPIGASVAASRYQLVANPATSHFPLDHSLRDAGVNETSASATPPHDEFVREVHFHAKEHREVGGRGGATNQFKDNAFINPHVHTRSDTATYFMSKEKRLSSKTQVQNHTRMQQCRRKEMCDEFDRLVPNAPQWSPMKHAEYVDRSVVEYASTRTQEAVLSKIASHDPDRTGSDIKITLKNQVIKKAEKKDKKEAIPGQLVHEYDVQQTLHDAPYALFLEDELIDSFPSNFMFYRRMSPQQFIDKYKLRWRVNNGVYSSDVTCWDVGCDAGMLNFDVHVMRRCGLPAEYVAGYIERRLSSRSQHGPMGTMQNSGDRYTWSLNSIRRAVVTSLVNKVAPEDTVAINGDDSAIDRFALSEVFPDSPWIFKDQNGMRGEFSGFELGGPEPKYSASGILYRTMILESRDPSAMDKWVNYLDLLAFADADSPEAAAVAFSAKRHMKPDLFKAYLPERLRSLFADVDWFE